MIPVQPYYSISAGLLLHGSSDQPQIEGSVRLNILLDIPSSGLPAVFAALAGMKNNFLFSLPASLFTNPEDLKTWLPACYMLTSLSNYAATGETILPVFGDSWMLHADEAATSIRQYFFEQGIRNVQIPFFNQRQKGAQQTESICWWICDVNDSELILETSSVTNIIHFLPVITDIAGFNQCIKAVKISCAVKNFTNHYAEKKIYEQEIQNWQQRALLYKSFLSLSKSVQQKEYYEVLDWYKKEYEALPLWYKQFGHILKVIMGKRSFRSLFNDNIKKHKA